MSISQVKLNIIHERDSRFIETPVVITDTYNKNHRQWTPISYSNSSIFYSCPTPSPETFIDTNIDLLISLTCEIVSLVKPQCYAYDENLIKIKDNALYILIESVMCTINNCNLIEKYSDILVPLTKIFDFNNRNFIKINILENNINNSDSECYMKSKIEFSLRSPLLFFKENEVLGGINDMSLKINLNEKINDIFYSDDVISITTSVSNSKLFVKYLFNRNLITKNVDTFTNSFINKTLYSTQAGNERFNNVIDNKESLSINSNVLCFSSIPEKIIIYVKDNKNIYYPIENISFNMNNMAGLLSEVSTEDLFLISKNNGLKTDWSDFQKESFIIIGKDEFMLQMGQYPGSFCQCMFDLRVNIKNIYDKVMKKDLTLCILLLNNYMLITSNFQTNYLNGYLTREDILN